MLIDIRPYPTGDFTARHVRSHATVIPNVMPTPLNTFCSASRSHLRARSKNANVWVSDELLTDTFNAFVRNHTRHGSNVPGPLEARRRSGKRKLTSLGQSAVANHSFDPAGLFGCQPQAGWWKTPEPRDQVQQQPVFYWPFPTLNSLPELNPQTHFPSTVEGPGRGESLARPAQSSATKDEQLSERLREIHTYEALISVLDEANIDLIQKPHLARRILGHMTRNKWHFKEVAAFLLEPRTNPAGSSNHAYLFKHWNSHIALLTRLVKRKTILKATELGLLGVDDVKEIVLLVYKVHPSIFPSGSRAAFGSALLDSIECSKVLNLKDLGEPRPLKWLRLVRANPFEASTPQLLWRLCGISTSDHGLRLRRVVSISLSMINRSSIHLLSHLVDFLLAMPQDLLHQTIFRYTWILRQSGTEKSADAKPYVAEALLATFRANYGRGSTSRHSNQAITGTRPSTKETNDGNDLYEPSKIDVWYAVLASLSAARPNGFTLSQSAFEEWVDNGKADSDKRDRLIVGLWVVMATAVHDNSVLDNFQNITLGRMIFEHFSADCEERGEDILASILTILRKTSFPARNKLLRRLETLSGGFINIRSSYETLQEQLTSLNERDLPKLNEKLFYSSARHHFPRLLRSVAESVNKDLSRFEQICCDIIRDMKGSIALVLRLLCHNQGLKFALSRAASGMAEDTVSSLQNDRAAPTDHALGGYTYAQLVDMIDHFAMECATTTTLSDRNALRKVYWLHMYLQMHGAPLTPRIRRALWHAVAVRPVEPTYTMVKYVYDLVVEYEGWDAAQKLLHSSASQAKEEVSQVVEVNRPEQLMLHGVNQEDQTTWTERYQMDGLKLVEADLEAELRGDDDSGGYKTELTSVNGDRIEVRSQRSTKIEVICPLTSDFDSVTVETS